MNIFEKYLKKNSEADETLSYLWAHWNSIKPVIKSNLEYISNAFPHFTIHNASHSEAILNNLARIIREEVIEKFSCIDLWLLILASYFHDIGMFIAEKDFRDCFDSKDFLEFIKNAIDNPFDSNHKYAKYFLIDNGVLKQARKSVSLVSYNALTFLISEFYRTKHAERAKKMIQSNSMLCIYDSIISQRLIKLLANICAAHNQTFEELMLLSKEQTGLDQSMENCHPRFVAAMIRLGDLLDVDCNRIPKFAIQMLGNSIPCISLTNYAKHLAISELNVNNKEITIIADCMNYKVADLTNHWFELIKNEINDLHYRWSDIIPSEYGITIPIVRNLKVNLAKYDTFDNKKSPRFSIDVGKASELLQGSGIYESKYSAITELLQNAADATLLYIWQTNKIKINSFEDFINICKKYPIELDIKELDKTDNKNRHKYWEITITDHGIGMDTYAIEVLTKIGAVNLTNQKIIESMPEYMKPIGGFGIGFHSIFNLSNKVKIFTRHYKSNKTIEVILLKQKKQLQSDASMRIFLRTESKANIESGTIIKFTVSTSIMPDKKYPFNTFITDRNRNEKEEFYSYDFIKKQSINFEIGKLRDCAHIFTLSSFIPLKVNGNELPFYPYSPQIDKLFNSYYFSNMIVIGDFEKKGDLNIAYRNCHLMAKYPIKFFNGIVNIFIGKTSKILDLTKKRFVSEKINDMLEKVIFSITDYLTNMVVNYCYSNTTRAIMSMFLNTYREIIVDKSKLYKRNDIKRLVNSDFMEEYKAYTIKDETIDNMLKAKQEISFIKCTASDFEEKILKRDNGLCICFDDVGQFIAQIAVEKYGFKRMHILGDNEFKLSKNDDYSVQTDNLYLLKNHERDYFGRNLLPCLDEYKKLAINLDSIGNSIMLRKLQSIMTPWKFPTMPSPYVRDKNNVFRDNFVLNTDGLADYIYSHRLKVDTTKEEIEICLKEFIKNTKDLFLHTTNNS